MIVAEYLEVECENCGHILWSDRSDEIERDFQFLLKHNPEEAYRILNEMIIVEGKEFAEKILGGVS